MPLSFLSLGFVSTGMLCIVHPYSQTTNKYFKKKMMQRKVEQARPGGSGLPSPTAGGEGGLEGRLSRARPVWTTSSSTV